MTIGLPEGIRSRYNASTFKNHIDWIDLYGNNHAKNVEGGAARVIPKNEFHQGPNGIPRSKGFPYVEGEPNSRWNLAEQFQDGNWTVAYIIRYDPLRGPRARILDVSNSTTMFGHWGGRAGISYQEGWVRGPDGIGDNRQWIFGIELPKRYIVRGGVNKNWHDKRGGSDLHKVEITIMNGNKSRDELSERSRWNIAEIIYWPKVLNDNELNKVKEYFDAYAEGKIDVLSGDGHGIDYIVKDYNSAVITAAKAMALTVVDLLHGNAEKGKEIIDKFEPLLSKDSYLKLLRSMYKQENFESLKNILSENTKIIPTSSS